MLLSPPQDVDGDDLKLEDFDVPLREWIALSKVERQVSKRFSKFLGSYADAVSGEKVYPRKIGDMCAGAPLPALPSSCSVSS